MEKRIKGLRIFLVENHPDTLVSLQTYLEGLGHLVFTARTMKEALQKLPTANPQVLISDIGLPDGTGWELLRRAFLSPQVYAVAMTGFGMSTDSERSHAAGFRHHLVKPFDLDELDRLLEESAATSN